MTFLHVAIQVITILLLVVYGVILVRSNLNSKLVKRSALIILAAGTALYMFGFSRESFSEGTVTLFLRSLTSAAKMFIYDQDLFELEEAQREPFFLDLFFLVFYAAVLTSISAVLMIFGKRLKTFFVLAFRRKPFDHVFIGVNERSLLIASGITEGDIAFIEFPDENEHNGISIKNVLGNFNKKDSAHSGPEKVIVLRAKDTLNIVPSGCSVLEGIGLGKLAPLIGPDTAFYILGEDNDKNLKDLLAIISDDSLINNTVHACVRREGLARSYQGALGKTGAHFIYPSSLSVVELMKRPECHPASVMAKNGDGTVSGEFGALIIGLGETGQAATRFIYEFSSAVLADGSPMPVKIYVNDDRLEMLRGHFEYSCPEMGHGTTVVYEDHKIESDVFWSTLISRLDSLNYIEISMQDDAMDLDIACNIFSYAQKMRSTGFENLRIVVRKRHTPDYEKRLVARLNEKAGHEVIVCYGEYDKIFTPEMIVSKSRSGINKGATSLSDTIADSYKALTGRDAFTENDGTYAQKRLHRRETHQMISRANHVPSKRILCGLPDDVKAADLGPEMLENLAMVEHLRYSRYLLAHGYTAAATDDDIIKTSHLICPWSDLTEEEKQYHRDMVRASLDIQANQKI